MGQLTNLYVSQSYQGLIKLADSTTGVTGTLQYTQDGVGNNLPLQISTTTVNITGSFLVNGQPVQANIDTGSLVTTASFNAYTSSNDSKVNSLIAATGSYVTESETGSFATKGSVDAITGSINSLNAATSSFVTETESGSFMITGSVAGNTLTFTKGNGSQFSLQVNTGSVPAGTVSGSQQIVDLGFATTSSLTSLSSSIATTDLAQNNRLSSLETTTGSLQNQINQKLDTGSFNSYTSSNDARVNSLESKTGSYATTGSNNFVGQQNINGSVNVTGSINVTGELTALSASITYLETIYQTSSVIFSSGSNILGDEAGDTQTLWGKVQIPTGPVSVTGSVIATNFTGSLEGNASTATSASFATNALSSSFSTNATTAVSASQAQNSVSSSQAENAVSASFATNSLSASFATNATTAVSASQSQNAVSASQADNAISSSQAQNAISSSYATNALSASYAPSSVNTSSFATTGSNVFRGNQTLTGSFNQTGSMNVIGNPGDPSATIARFGDPNYGVVDITDNGQLTVTNALRVTSIQNWNTVGSSNITVNNTLGDVYMQPKVATGSVILGRNQSSKIQITGSLLSPSITGSLEGTASYATQALSASYATNALTASFALNGGGGSINTGSFAITGSNQFSGSQEITGALKVVLYDQPYDSYFTFAEFNAANDPAIQFNTNTKVEGGNLSVSGDIKGNFITDKDGSNPLTISGSQGISVSGSLSVSNGITGSLEGTASYATNALTASFALNGGGGGSAFPYTGSAVITGSLKVIGDSTMTGSINISGSIFMVNGSDLVTHHIKAAGSNGLELLANNGAIIASMGAGGGTQANFTGSLSSTTFSSPSITGSLQGTASYAVNALTASFALNGGSGGAAFPYTGSAVITGSLTVIGDSIITGSLTLSGSANPELTVIGNTILTGSLQGNVNALSISSNTASLNLDNGNFFTLQLVSGSNTFINPSNIKPGQTINMLLSTTGSATVTFPTTVKQAGSFPYIPTPTTSKDIITLVSFDGTNLYLSNIKNLI